jgi:hypothetical protein
LVVDRMVRTWLVFGLGYRQYLNRITHAIALWQNNASSAAVCYLMAFGIQPFRSICLPRIATAQRISTAVMFQNAARSALIKQYEKYRSPPPRLQQ